MAAQSISALLGAPMPWWFAGLIGVSLTAGVGVLAVIVGR